MTDDDFLHKAFLGEHDALPVRFCNSCDEIIPTLQKLVAGMPRPKLEIEPPGVV